MHAVREMLIERNGCFCMLCGKECSYSEIEWHHIKWKSISLRQGKKPDNSYENGALLCDECHKYVHSLEYNSDEYNEAIVKIKKRKKP